MAKCMGQWKQLANKDLILCRRRFFFFFTKFESYKNHLRRKEIKLNKQAAALQKTYDEMQDLILKGNEILYEIDETSGETDPFVTAPAKHEFPLLRWSISDVPPVPDHWTQFENALKGGSGMAGGLPEISGVVYTKATKTDFMGLDEGKKDYHDDFKQESVGATATDIKSYNKQQQGKKRPNN